MLEVTSKQGQSMEIDDGCDHALTRICWKQLASFSNRKVESGDFGGRLEPSTQFSRHPLPSMTNVRW
jgi:hypothetical protein